MAAEVQRAIGVVSAKEYAAHRGVSPAYISKLKRLGKLAAPAVLADGRINVTLADQMLGETTLQLDMSPSSAPSMPVGGMPSRPVYQDERARREAALREQEEIALAKEKKQIRHAGEVDRDIFEAVRTARDALLLLPAQMAEDLAAETAPRAITYKLQTAITAVLDKLATHFEAAAVAPIEETAEYERSA